MGYRWKHQKCVRKVQFRPLFEVACCLGEEPVDLEELSELTGLRPAKIKQAVRELLHLHLIAEFEHNVSFVAHFTPKFRGRLKKYWQTAHGGILNDTKERSCLKCSRRFVSTWAGERTCPACRFELERLSDTRPGRMMTSHYRIHGGTNAEGTDARYTGDGVILG